MSLPTLVVDAMLGRLARWLRALGYDVVFDPALDDDALLHIAREDHRLLLTRDRHLCQERAGDRCLLVRARKPDAQILELAPRLGLFGAGWRDRLFSRCMVCGPELEPIEHGDVEDRLPEEVRRDPRVRSAGFHRCPDCDQVFWEGSHTRRMRGWLSRVASIC